MIALLLVLLAAYAIIGGAAVHAWTRHEDRQARRHRQQPRRQPPIPYAQLPPEDDDLDRGADEHGRV